MECKNCGNKLTKGDQFCSACGAKVVTERITFKNLVLEGLLKALGWDNKFFTTTRLLITKPQEVFESYIGGVRKRYVNPIVYFAIGMTISILVFNGFRDDYTANSGMGDVSISFENNTEEITAADLSTETVDNPFADNPEMQAQMEAQANQMKAVRAFILNYYNLLSFALLPLYTLISMWVFGRKYNYGEHLVINGYLQGLSFIFLSLCFILSLIFSPSVYGYSSLITILLYSYSYARLYRQSFGKALLYFLKFIGICLLLVLGLFLLLLGLQFVL